MLRSCGSLITKLHVHPQAWPRSIFAHMLY
jgi:hypothetical protein